MTPHQRSYILSRPTDQPAADVVSGYAALPPLTARMIPLDELAPLLRELGLMSAIKSIVAAQDTDAAVRAGLTDFLDQLADPRVRNLDTTRETIAVRAAAMLAALSPVAQALGLDPAAVTGQVYALGGGLRYPPGLTGQHVADVRAEAARRATADSLIAQAHARYNAFVASVETWRDSGQGEAPEIGSL
jgi:hypothetical protein